MFRLDVLQDQWLILALFGGTALVLAVVLAYLALWRRREGEPADGPAAAERSDSHGVPWVMIFVFAATALFALAYLLMRAAAPPNW